MTYPLTVAAWNANEVPVPAAPQIRDAAKARTVRLGLLLALACAAPWGVLGFISPTTLFAGDSVLETVVAVCAVAYGAIGGMATWTSLRPTLSVLVGHARVFRQYGNSHRSRCPVEARPLRTPFAWAGTATGLAVAAIGRAVDADPVPAVAAAALAVPAAVGLLRSWPRAAAANRAIAAERARRAAILAHGDHVVGRLASVRARREWIDSRTVSIAELVFEYKGQTHSRLIQVVDHPVWVPADGNEYDVWIDPSAPSDPGRVMVSRRYVGQRFAGNPKTHRSPGEADSGPGPIAPPWMSNNPTKTDRTAFPAARAVRFILASPPVAVAAAVLATAVLAPIQVDGVSGTSRLLLWAYAAVNAYNAVLYLMYAARSRWLARTGLRPAVSALAAASSVGAAVAAMVSSPTLFHLFAPPDRPWTAAHVLIIVSVIGSLLVFVWSFVTMEHALRYFNGDRPAPAEAVQEAMTGPDPAAIGELERRYGYRAGAFLMYD